jgi:NAD(P)-dependent dehydrogenase (short-subunit alcohol dehydrogenase family)
VTRWTTADLPDPTGCTIVVTGGLGLVTHRELARSDARVISAVRAVSKSEQAPRAMAADTEVPQRGVALRV